jgi:hypothetical protein
MPLRFFCRIELPHQLKFTFLCQFKRPIGSMDLRPKDVRASARMVVLGCRMRGTARAASASRSTWLRCNRNNGRLIGWRIDASEIA